MKETATCFAWVQDGEWAALCVDFDLVAHGKSFEEVKNEIQEAIETYACYVSELPEPERTRLMNRKAPLALRLRLECFYAISRLLNLLRIRLTNLHSFQPAVVWNPIA